MPQVSTGKNIGTYRTEQPRTKMKIYCVHARMEIVVEFICFSNRSSLNIWCSPEVVGGPGAFRKLPEACTQHQHETASVSHVAKPSR